MRVTGVYVDYLDYNHHITEEQYNKMKDILDKHHISTVEEVVIDATYFNISSYRKQGTIMYTLLTRPGELVQKYIATNSDYLVRKWMRVV